MMRKRERLKNERGRLKEIKSHYRRVKVKEAKKERDRKKTDLY